MCDPCVYVKSDSSSKVFIAIHVDDLVVTGSSEVCISKTKAFLMAKFRRKDQGDFSLILGIQVSRDRLKVTLDINQGSYVNAILHRYGFVASRSVSTPSTAEPLDLKTGTMQDESNKQLYQEVWGVSSSFRRVRAGTLPTP